jgi:hypothetical protein
MTCEVCEKNSATARARPEHNDAVLCDGCFKDAMSDSELNHLENEPSGTHSVRDRGVSLRRRVVFEFRGISRQAALEAMSNGSCGD